MFAVNFIYTYIIVNDRFLFTLTFDWNVSGGGGGQSVRAQRANTNKTLYTFIRRAYYYGFAFVTFVYYYIGSPFLSAGSTLGRRLFRVRFNYCIIDGTREQRNSVGGAAVRSLPFVDYLNKLFFILKIIFRGPRDTTASAAADGLLFGAAIP